MEVHQIETGPCYARTVNKASKEIFLSWEGPRMRTIPQTQKKDVLSILKDHTHTTISAAVHRNCKARVKEY